MTARDLTFAPGMEEAIVRDAGFATLEEALAFWNAAAPEVETKDLTFPGSAGQAQPVRIYRGAGADALTLIYIHGGGWAGGSIAHYDSSARGLAAGSKCNVVSISYRLAPEYPYPAGLQDCLAAVDWVKAKGAALGINPSRLAIGGGSAGANLATAVALDRPDTFIGLLIFYGVFGGDLSTQSYIKYATGPGLTQARMSELFDGYDPQTKRDSDPLITPLASNRLHTLPPTYILAAEHDVLLDDNLAFGAALDAAQVPNTLVITPGVIHGFINRARLVPRAALALEQASVFLCRLGEKGE